MHCNEYNYFGSKLLIWLLKVVETQQDFYDTQADKMKGKGNPQSSDGSNKLPEH